MKIYHCEVNHLTNPLGFQMDKTVFSWCVGETTAKLQKSARLLVSQNPDLSQPEYDSGAAQLDSIACVVPPQVSSPHPVLLDGGGRGRQRGSGCK